MEEINQERMGRKTFAIVMRGHPDDFLLLLQQAKAAGLYVVFSKSSTNKLIIEEASW